MDPKQKHIWHGRETFCLIAKHAVQKLSTEAYAITCHDFIHTVVIRDSMVQMNIVPLCLLCQELTSYDMQYGGNPT